MTWPTIFDAKLSEYEPLDMPGEQLAATQAELPLEHILNLDIEAPSSCQRLTGIIASIGRASYDVEIMERMMEAGMNMAYLNMTFGTIEEHVTAIERLREAANNFAITMGQHCSLTIGIRLCGRKIRTGTIADTFGGSVELIAGETVRVTTDDTYKDRCSNYAIYVDFDDLAEQLNRGNLIILDNDLIQLKVDVISATTLTCIIERGGILGSNKDVFIPNVVLHMPNCTDADKLNIKMAKENDLDFVIVPFVNSLDSLKEIRMALGSHGKKIAIIANIQTYEGYRNFDDIMKVAAAVMISRQELGSDVTPKKLVIAQKNMIARANLANVPVFISAQLLSSMRYNKIPLRAELLDIGNCVLDGADCLELSSETSVGLYPVETVTCMAETCKEAEACVWSRQVLIDLIEKTVLPCNELTGMAIAAVMAAQSSLAAVIVVLTNSGKTAQAVSKYRPRCPVLAVTKTAAARKLHMWKGIMPLVYNDPIAKDWPHELKKRIDFAIDWAMDREFVKAGDPIVIVSGCKQGSGHTNSIRVIYAAPQNKGVLPE